MAATIGTRAREAFNAFVNADRKEETNYGYIPAVSYGNTRPDRVVFTGGGEKSIFNSIITRLALDIAIHTIRHVRIDTETGMFKEHMKSGLDDCLLVEANIDQSGLAFRLDLAYSLLEKGTVAIVAVDTSSNPNETGSFDVKTFRVGEIVHWYARHVRVSVYNERKGERQEITLPKSQVAIIENPMYTVMNEKNSTLQRLKRKLALLDGVDEIASSGKLDLIIQLPYVIKSDARKNQAEERRAAIETQLSGSKYGIAYAEATEKITQLNRPVENNMMAQIKFLHEQLYNQLGLTQGVFDGTADEKAINNYYSRTINPILQAITEGFARTFLTKTARTQGQTINYYRNFFQFATVTELSEAADKFTRNEILSSNEFRGIMGFKPSTDPKADELVNSNVPQPVLEAPAEPEVPPMETPVSQLL